MKNKNITDLINMDFPTNEPIEVNQEQANYIIENRKPLGVFYLKAKEGGYVGIDNSANESFVEEFIDKETCIAWLTNTNITYNTESGYGKRVNELVIEESNANTYEIIIKEELVTSVKINADSEEEALRKAESMYNNETIVLDWEDFSHVEFRAETIE